MKLNNENPTKFFMIFCVIKSVDISLCAEGGWEGCCCYMAVAFNWLNGLSKTNQEL